jgi:ABC-type transport system involved in multi-copper enzyme maturation permease subunit
MDITIPAIPLGIIALLGFFGPYAVGALNAILPFVKTPVQRKVVTVVFSILLAAVVIGLYLLSGGWAELEPLGVTALVIIAVLVVSASYALFTYKSASKLEANIEAKHLQ